MAAAAGAPLAKPALYDLFYEKALEGEADCGGLVSYNYYSGEPVTGLAEGRPLMVRRPDARLTLANLARVQLYAAMATLKLGMDILFEGEGVRLDTLLGHGGLFKTPVVGQRLLAGALGVPVAVMETAGEGGPWGMALLAAYMLEKRPGETLEQYLANRVFADARHRPAPAGGGLRGLCTVHGGLQNGPRGGASRSGGPAVRRNRDEHEKL